MSELTPKCAAGLAADGVCFKRYAADGVPDPLTGEFDAELCVPVK